MASLIRDPNGRWRIQFLAADKRRKTIRLGKMSRQTAHFVLAQVEILSSCRLTHQPLPPETQLWLRQCEDTLLQRLARVGLISRQDVPELVLIEPGWTLQKWVEEYLKMRERDVKPSTLTVLRQAARHLLRIILPATPLEALTPLHGDQIRQALLRRRSKSTANKWTRICKQIFQAAVERRLLRINPLGHIRGLTVTGNVQRRQFIPAEEVRKVLAVIPCAEFRAIVALARWGGLRVPSEVQALRWSDVDLVHGRILVRASKTAHHQSGGLRVVPLFPELRPFLEALPRRGERVISRCHSASNLRTQLARYCRRAGIPPWPKPFQNMRATRATELADCFPSHVCAAWLGHTERIADAFYRSVTDEHYARAISVPTSVTTGGGAAQKAAQSEADTSGQE